MENQTETSLKPGDEALLRGMIGFTFVNGVVVLIETWLTSVTIWRTPTLNSNENIFVFSLSVTDGVVGVICATYCFLYALRTHFSNLVFNVFFMVLWSMLTVSVVHLALVAADRALCVAKPFFYERRITRKVAVLEVLITWIVCILVLSLTAVIDGLRGELNYGFAEVNAKTSLRIVMAVAYFVCSVIIIASYVIIWHVALRQRKAISRVTRSVVNQDGCAGDNFEVLRRWRNVMKSVKFFIVVCGAFFSCMTLVVVIGIVRRFLSVHSAVIGVSNCLAVLNSTMNPVIYAVMNKHFRKALKKTCQDFVGKYLPRCQCKYRSQ